VYLARETGLQRLVAVKILDPDLALEPVTRQRFERAARAAARVRHRNVVAIHRVSTLADGTPFMVMEYVEGRSLADALTADGLPDSATARDILRDIAAALAASHENRVVHRDLRPANVLREDRTGRIVLTDFGLARILDSGSEEFAHLTRPGQILGDPSHISPEQIRGEPVTHETDMYSFGVLGYHVLAGRGPFQAEGTARLLQAHSASPPDDVREFRPDVDPDLADLLERCLAKKPEHRPRAADVVRILSETQNRVASPAVTPPPPGGARPSLEAREQRVDGEKAPAADPADLGATEGAIGPERWWRTHGWPRRAAMASIVTLVALVAWWFLLR
jgi:serine/threonine protein kinase